MIESSGIRRSECPLRTRKRYPSQTRNRQNAPNLHLTPQEVDLTKTDRHDLVTGSKARLFCIAFFFLAVASTYLPWYLHSYRSFKLEDSGIFLYVGQRLLHGDVLYRDIADNKPPLIYWLNAL